ncbi:MAG: zf-HC2 domain-containing protein [Candidatus Aminicenantales bacterium]|jgi:anti-sigma factor RsiW
MRCEKSKRWISEDLDGRLSGKDKARLDAHVEDCPGCRAYRTALERIQGAALRTVDQGPGPAYFAAALVRLRSELSAEAASASPAGRRAPAFVPRVRWAWAGAGSLLLAATVVFFSVSRTRLPQDLYALAFDEPLASFEHQIADSPELASDFDRAVRMSLRDSVQARPADVEPLLTDHNLLVESLTEDEIAPFDTALQSEITRTHGRI